MHKKILFQGDSITDAGRSRDNDNNPGTGYPLLVKAQLGAQEPDTYDFINRGISGNRIVDLYARIKIDFTNIKPDYLSILIGVNDVWHELGGRHNGVDAEKFEWMYDRLITEIREACPDCKIMILAPFVLEGGATRSNENEPDRWQNFRDETPLRAEAARRVAEKHGLHFVELQPIFDEACKQADGSYWLGDGVHPTPMGHQLIAQAWLKAFEELK